jgi:hypothetical protein
VIASGLVLAKHPALWHQYRNSRHGISHHNPQLQNLLVDREHQTRAISQQVLVQDVDCRHVKMHSLSDQRDPLMSLRWMAQLQVLRHQTHADRMGTPLLGEIRRPGVSDLERLKALEDLVLHKATPVQTSLEMMTCLQKNLPRGGGRSWNPVHPICRNEVLIAKAQSHVRFSTRRLAHLLHQWKYRHGDDLRKYRRD